MSEDQKQTDDPMEHYRKKFAESEGVRNNFIDAVVCRMYRVIRDKFSGYGERVSLEQNDCHVTFSVYVNGAFEVYMIAIHELWTMGARGSELRAHVLATEMDYAIRSRLSRLNSEKKSLDDMFPNLNP